MKYVVAVENIETSDLLVELREVCEVIDFSTTGVLEYTGGVVVHDGVAVCTTDSDVFTKHFEELTMITYLKHVRNLVHLLDTYKTNKGVVTFLNNKLQKLTRCFEETTK